MQIVNFKPKMSDLIPINDDQARLSSLPNELIERILKEAGNVRVRETCQFLNVAYGHFCKGTWNKVKKYCTESNGYHDALLKRMAKVEQECENKSDGFKLFKILFDRMQVKHKVDFENINYETIKVGNKFEKELVSFWCDLKDLHNENWRKNPLPAKMVINFTYEIEDGLEKFQTYFDFSDSWTEFYCNHSINLVPQIGYLKNLTSFKADGLLRSQPYLPLKTLPKEFFGLTGLKTLNVVNSKICQLPSEIGKLVNLTELDLHGCSEIKIPDELGLCLNLQNLNISLCKLDTVPSAIFKLHKLEILDIGYNYTLTCIPDAIGELSSLRRLDIWHSGIKAFPSSLCLLPRLEVINVYDKYWDSCHGCWRNPEKMPIMRVSDSVAKNCLSGELRLYFDFDSSENGKSD